MKIATISINLLYFLMLSLPPAQISYWSSLSSFNLVPCINYENANNILFSILLFCLNFFDSDHQVQLNGCQALASFMCDLDSRNKVNIIIITVSRISFS